MLFVIAGAQWYNVQKKSHNYGQLTDDFLYNLLTTNRILIGSNGSQVATESAIILLWLRIFLLLFCTYIRSIICVLCVAEF